MAEINSKKPAAPDGGWGWMIVLAFATSNIITIPILQSFGLLFRPIFEELEMSATDISTIININSAFGLLLGLWNGPLLRKFGYRKMAIIGTLFISIGFGLTSQAYTFYQFIIYYGIINSIGFTLSMSSFSLALNTYFKKKRSMASGICVTVTGLGPVVMPLFISICLEYYGGRGTALILTGLSLHAFMAALLLQPVKWHYKKLEDDETIIGKELQVLNPNKENGEVKELINECPEKESEEKLLDNIVDSRIDTHSIHGVENVPVPRKISEMGRRLSITQSKLSIYEKNDKLLEPDSKWWSKESNHPQKEECDQMLRRLQSEEQTPTINEATITTPTDTPNNKEFKKKPTKWYMKVVKYFDLDLLKDGVYRNIWLGMSLAFTGEINFSLLTPLILGHRKFSIEQTATLMSIIASADIIFRFLSPFIGEKTNIPPRYMYMCSLLMLITSRCALTFVYSYVNMMVVCIALGISKGFRTVYMTLVIPNYVPLEKLPSASGLQTVLNGILLLGFGPIVGLVKDKTGSYNLVIHFINCLSMSTILLWSIEYLVTRYKKKRENLEEKLEGTLN